LKFHFDIPTYNNGIYVFQDFTAGFTGLKNVIHKWFSFVAHKVKQWKYITNSISSWNFQPHNVSGNWKAVVCDGDEKSRRYVHVQCAMYNSQQLLADIYVVSGAPASLIIMFYHVCQVSKCCMLRFSNYSYSNVH
jgi:hypothetical protein